MHQLLYDINYAFDIIGITETWIRSKCTDNIIVNIDLPGYTFLSQPTQQRVGGVGVYIKNSLKFHSRDELNLCRTECETFWIDIENQLDKNIICCIIYRHPNSNLECFLNQLFTLIEKENTENKYCFLLGDFNIDLLNYDTHTQTEDFINTLNSYFFEPHIIKPTRITDHTATLIDNIFFNSVDFDAISGNLIFDLTDHLSNFLIINDLKPSSKKEYLYRRDFSNFNEQSFLSAFKKINWNQVFEDCDDIDQMFQSLYTKSNDIIDQFIPLKKLSRKEVRFKAKLWITSGLKTSVYKKNKLYKNYLKQRNENALWKYKAYAVAPSRNGRYPELSIQSGKNIINNLALEILTENLETPDFGDNEITYVLKIW